MEHIAEIINVGTEILLGNILNSNSQMLSEELSELGINVYYHTVVGDNPERLRAAVEIAKSRADIIITTGGLGPTCDDLTKQTLAAAFGKKLRLDEPSAERIRSYFEDRLHVAHMTDNNMQQAMLPEGCTIFDNDWGTAPGCAFEADGVHVVMLPGPPRECGNMFRHRAVPYLRALSDTKIYSVNMRIFGMGESAVEDKLSGMMLEMTNPSLAPYAKEGEVMLRATVKTDSGDRARELLDPVVEKVRGIFGDLIYTTEHDSMQELVLSLLTDRGQTLAAAESCTGGMLSSQITDLPGASKAFKGGVVAYTNDIKTNVLGVPAMLLEEKGAVCREVAEAMAKGVRERFGADIGLGITGLAGPDGDGTDTEVGTVFIALAAGDRCVCREVNAGSGRYRVRVMGVRHGFDLVRRYILGMKL